MSIQTAQQAYCLRLMCIEIQSVCASLHSTFTGCFLKHSSPLFVSFYFLQNWLCQII